MKYLFSKSDYESKKSRQEYLYDVFKLCTIEKNNSSDFIILDSIPIGELDMMFIIGHDTQVYNYLRENIDNIQENNIIAITCNYELLKEFINKGKTIFVPRINENIVKRYKGSEYGFEFDITDSELDMFNNRRLEAQSNIERSMSVLEL